MYTLQGITYVLGVLNFNHSTINIWHDNVLHTSSWCHNSAHGCEHHIKDQ